MIKKELEFEFVDVLQGSLSIGHRPRMKSLSQFSEAGVTHVLTLLSEKEGALDIKKAVKLNSMEWLWIPLINGKPPMETLIPAIKQAFEECKKLLINGSNIYIHCSAGIHRTGMITYALLLFLGYSESESKTLLTQMRQVTGEGVGEQRVQWAKSVFS